MAVIALAGGLGAPGVTTTALALLQAWPLEPGRRMVLAECDPDGGAVMAGALQGQMADRWGLRNLSVASRKGELTEAFWRQLVDLSEDGAKERLLLPGITDPAQAASLTAAWEGLADLFAGIGQHGHDVLVDLGRRGAFGASSVLAQRADLVVVVARPTVRSLRSAHVRVAALHEQLGGTGSAGADAVRLLLVEDGPYPAREVERELKVPVVAAMPWRPKQAAVLSDGAEPPRRFEVSELMRAARTAAGRLWQQVLLRRARLAPPSSSRVGREVSGAR